MTCNYDWSPYLRDGEEVLWQGRPDGRFRFFLHTWDVALIPFGMLCMAVGSLGLLSFLRNVLSMFFGGSVRPVEETFVLFLFFAVGYLLTVFRPRADQKLRQQRRYAVTSQRALVADAERQQIVAATTIEPDLFIDLTLGKYTTIKLNPWMKADEARNTPAVMLSHDAFGMHKAVFGGYTERGVEFRFLPDGRDVANLLRDLKAKTAERTP